MSQYELVTCPTCNHGYVIVKERGGSYSFQTCPDCDGNGMVMEWKAAEIRKRELINAWHKATMRPIP